MSVRRAVARPAAVKDLDEAVRRYESSRLPHEIKVLLRLADAFLADPAGFDDRAREELLDHYAPAQVVEALLKLVYFSGNKTTNALGLDAPIDSGRLSVFDYDEAGRFVLRGLGSPGVADP
jgi:hypothetical protein